MKCLYDVLLPPDVVKCDIEEKAILPRHFEHRLLLNSPCFKVCIFLLDILTRYEPVSLVADRRKGDGSSV